jgi:hypothetical protein
MKKMKKPKTDEYNEFYQGYISQVGDQEVFGFLERNIEEYVVYIKSQEDTRLSYSYAPEKWTLSQVLGHISDVERVMAYRILRFSRKDKTEIPGFDQDHYVENGFFDSSRQSYIKEIEALRSANLELIRNLKDEQLSYTGIADGNLFTVRALIYILAGHMSHHLNVLKKRY